MELLKNIFLNQFINEYNVYIFDYNNLKKEVFYKKYRNIVSFYEKDDFMEWSFEEYTLFILFCLYKKVIFTIDWSGEEYSGQVKKGLNVLLKRHGVENMKWRKDIYKNILNEQIRRGEYLPLLFKEFNQNLEKINYVLGFFDMGDDAYYYFVLQKNEYEKIKHYDKVNDTKLFELYLMPESINTKLLIYIKRKFDLKLDEVKYFIKKDKILMETGDKIIIKNKKKELEEMGGKIIIEEII